MKINIIKNQEVLDKIYKKDLKDNLSLYINFSEKYVGDITISFYKIVKEKNENGEYVRKKKKIYEKQISVSGKNYIHNIPEEILKSLEVGEEYLYSIKTDDEMGEYRFKIEKKHILLFILIPVLLGIIALLGVLLFIPKENNIKNPVETIREIAGDVNSGTPSINERSEKENLLNYIQSYSRFVVSSAINVGSGNKCSFEISNPKKTTFQSDLSLEEINKILEGELNVYETDRSNVYEFDSINTIQVSLQDNEGNEYYCSPALAPDSYINTIELTKSVPESVSTLLAILKTFNPDGEYLNSFQFTIQVNR